MHIRTISGGRMSTNLAHSPVRYEDEHSGADEHDIQCSHLDPSKNDSLTPTHIHQKRESYTQRRQYDSDEERPENDVDAASPAGHLLSMVYHVGNACGEQSHARTSSKSITHKKETGGAGDRFIVISTAVPGRDIVLMTHAHQQQRAEEAERGDRTAQQGPQN